MTDENVENLNLEKIKKWILAQIAVAKTAWTIVVVIAGLWGYQAHLTPIEGGANTQETIEKRLSNIEQSLNTDAYIEPNLAKKLIDSQAQLAKDLEELHKFIEEQRKNPKSGYTIPLPNVK